MSGRELGDEATWAEVKGGEAGVSAGAGVQTDVLFVGRSWSVHAVIIVSVGETAV